MVKVDIMEAIGENKEKPVFVKAKIDDVIIEIMALPEECKSKEELAKVIVQKYKDQYREELMGEVEVQL